MDIYAEKGSKVVFKNRGGRDGEAEDANKILVEGEIYIVESIDVHSFSSYVTLKEFPNKEFNTVMFEDYKGAMMPHNTKIETDNKQTGKEFLSKLKIPTLAGKVDEGQILPFNKGTEHFVDNLDKGISTFLRLPRQNGMTVTNMCYATYILSETDKCIVIYSKTFEDARLNVERIKDICKINNLDFKKNNIYVNIIDSEIEEFMNTHDVGMIIYDNDFTDNLDNIKIYPDILTTFTSIYGDTDAIKDKLKEDNIEYLEYPFYEIGRDLDWFYNICKQMQCDWKYINKEILLNYK